MKTESEEEELEERLEGMEEKLEEMEAVVKKYVRQQGVDVEVIEESEGQVRESGNGGDN